MVSSAERRVVVTGVGVISPLGNSKESLWDALVSNRSGVGALTGVPTDYLPTSYAAEAHGFSGHIDDFGPLEKAQKKNIRKGLKLMCREVQMGVAAAQRALSDAGLRPELYDPDRTGVVFGADYMMTRPEEFVEGIRNCLVEASDFDSSRWAEDGLPKVEPLWLLKYLPNMPASHMAIYNDLRGPSNSITLREASANLSLAEAYCTIRRGAADIMIAGATGTRVHPMRTVHVATQEELAVNGSDPAKMSRPFDLNRTGLVLGEGAGAVVLEELETAQARGATILSEVAGYSSSSVLDHDSVAHCDAALRNVMILALKSAGMSPDGIGHLHAHGLSTRQSDIDESRAIVDVFGDRKSPVPVVAAKSYFGNLGAGGGVVELIASLLAIQHGTLFPVLNYETPDPECPISVVKPGSELDPGTSVLNVNVTPQGQASSVLVRKFE